MERAMHAMWWIWFPILMLFFFGPFRRGRYWRYRQRREFPGDPRPGSGSDAPRQEEELRRRDEQIESLETRVAELESRLDFTERLLAQRRDYPPLTGPAPA
jgi:hypothetical protein